MSGTQAASTPAINSPPTKVEPDHGPIHHEIVADRGETSVGCHPLPRRAAVGDGHIHFGVTFHAAGNALVRLFPGLFEKVLAEKPPEEKDQENDHERCADDFGQRELPTQEHQHDDAELEDEIGGGYLKGHCGREIRSVAED